MTDDINRTRRGFISTAAATAAMVNLGSAGFAQAQTRGSQPLKKLEPIEQIDAGVLNVGYFETGPALGDPVILLHGWPYDIHTYADVAALLASAGHRVIVPHLRGYGSTRFLASDTVRNGQQAAIAIDTIALMDALDIKIATVGGETALAMAWIEGNESPAAQRFIELTRSFAPACGGAGPACSPPQSFLTL